MHDTPSQSQPDQLLLGCIDAVLTDLLGGKVREAIYDYLERQFSLAKEEIPDHLDELSEILATTFGKSAATLERRIAARLYDALGLEFANVPNLGLNEHFALVRSIIERKEKETVSHADGPDYNSCVQALGVEFR
jgi:hypothetical protein